MNFFFHLVVFLLELRKVLCFCHEKRELAAEVPDFLFQKLFLLLAPRFLRFCFGKAVFVMRFFVAVKNKFPCSLLLLLQLRDIFFHPAQIFFAGFKQFPLA